MDEMKDFSIRFRRLQFDGLSMVLGKYSVDTKLWPAEAVMLFMDGIARFMGEERAYGLKLGHTQAIRVVERLIGELEGKRRRRRMRR
jgi:hypothetical protein